MNIYIYFSLYKKQEVLIDKADKEEKDLQILKRRRRRKKKINQHLRKLRSFPLLELISDEVLDNFHTAVDQYD